MVGEGFEPSKAVAGRFTVCSRWPLGYPTNNQSRVTASHADVAPYRADGENRTRNLLITNQLLRQLSYVSAQAVLRELGLLAAFRKCVKPLGLLGLVCLRTTWPWHPQRGRQLPLLTPPLQLSSKPGVLDHQPAFLDLQPYCIRTGEVAVLAGFEPCPQTVDRPPNRLLFRLIGILQSGDRKSVV